MTAAANTAATGWRAELGARRLAVALLLALAVAAALNPIFATPFPELLGRTLFVGLVLLLAFAAAGRWHPRWLAPWLARTLAVGLAAPLATALVYVAGARGDVASVLAHEGKVWGFLWIAGTGAVLGLLVALGALLREREAAAANLLLQLALERSQREKQALDARLALLQSQIEPHFLFNTLANVQALVDSGSPRAPEVLRSLTAYLRAAMPRLAGERATTLADEAERVRAYLALMHLRMPDRLQWQLAIAPSLLARPFPPMALLTLVENAVRHGIDPAEEGGAIEVGGEALADGGARLWVADTGRGLAPGAAAGTGLANLRERLAALHGPEAALHLRPHTPRGTRAEILLPPEPAP